MIKNVSVEDFQFLSIIHLVLQFQSLEDVILVYISKQEKFIIYFKNQKSKIKDLLYQIEQEFNEINNEAQHSI
jgi:hypothetical protein